VDPLCAITKRPLLRRLMKYASVSVVATLLSLSILGLLVSLAGMPAVEANLIAIAVGTVPSFELNRRWVWSLGDRRVRIAQVVPFCALSFAGLLLSTLAVHFASKATTQDPSLIHTFAIELGNFGSYGVLWVVQFVLCDRVLFTRHDKSRQTAGSRRVNGHTERGKRLPATVPSLAHPHPMHAPPTLEGLRASPMSYRDVCST
jgi:putative flippase GtrA